MVEQKSRAWSCIARRSTSSVDVRGIQEETPCSLSSYCRQKSCVQTRRASFRLKSKSRQIPAGDQDESFAGNRGFAIAMPLVKIIEGRTLERLNM